MDLSQSTLKSGLLAKVATQADANIANGRLYSHALPVQVYEHRLQSRTQTILAANVGTTTITMSPTDATEKTTLFAAACKLGGYPMIVGVVARVTQAIVLPDVSATATLDATAPIYERRALDTLNLSPGKAGTNYLMGKSLSWGRLMLIFDTVGGFSQVMKAMRTATSENTTSTPRAGRNTAAGMDMAVDSAGLMNSRQLVDNLDLRATWVNDAGGATTPQTNTQFQDCMYLPLTLDGTHGVVDAGMLWEDLFAPAPKWQIDYTPKNNVDLYPTVASGGTAATFGNMTVEWSVLYRVQPKSTGTICEGDVWRINDNMNAVTSGVQSSLNAQQCANNVYIGFLPIFWDDNTDGGRYWWILADANGVGTDYAPKMRIIRPSLSPAINFNTDGNFLRVGDGTTDVLPANPDDLLQRGDTILDTWNGRFYVAACHDPTDVYPEGRELPKYTEVGYRTATSTSALDVALAGAGAAALRYGATYAGGANQAYVSVPLNDDPGVLCVGGLAHLPIAWTDRQSRGFQGVATRTSEDGRPITLNTVGSFVYPVKSPNLTTVVWPVSAITFHGPYSAMTNNGCDPCGGKALAKPVIRQNNTRAPVGRLLTATSELPQVKPAAA